MVEELLKRGADVDVLDFDKRTPLHWAAYHGRVDEMETLLLAGADVNARDREGKTPLHDAAWENELEMVDVLLKFDAQVNVKDNDGRTPLHWAADRVRRTDNTNVVFRLLDVGAEINAQTYEGRTPLWSVVDNGNTEVVKQLLERGADERMQGKDGWTALRLAALRGESGDQDCYQTMVVFRSTQKAAELDRKLDQACDSWSPPAAFSNTIKTRQINQDTLTQAEQQAPVSRSRQRF